MAGYFYNAQPNTRSTPTDDELISTAISEVYNFLKKVKNDSEVKI